MRGIRVGIKRGVKFLQLLNAREFAFCSGSFEAVCIMRAAKRRSWTRRYICSTVRSSLLFDKMQMFLIF